jgi:hypothetical protein
MARKKKSVDTQFDENGNPVEVQEVTVKAVRIPMSDQTFDEILTAMLYCSRSGEVQYDKGEWGSELFSVRQTEEFAERMGVECDNFQIRQVFAAMLKDGYFGKMDHSRKYFYNSNYESELESKREEFRREIISRPTRRN